MIMVDLMVDYLILNWQSDSAIDLTTSAQKP
jgi:hypothetical protein